MMKIRASRVGSVLKYEDARARVLAAMRTWPAGTAFQVWAAAQAIFGRDVRHDAGLYRSASMVLVQMTDEGSIAWVKLEHRHRRRGGPVWGWVLVERPKIEIAQQKAASSTGSVGNGEA